MDNSTAHSTTSPSSVSASYVDAYMPPASQPQGSSVTATAQSDDQVKVVDPIPYTPPATDTVPAAVQPEPIIQSPDLPPLGTQPLPPLDMPASAPTSPSSTPSFATQPVAPKQPEQTNTASEELEDQNIFTMLGVNDGTPEQRETFLDELQQVIWEDFLEYDVKLLTTKEEQVELEKMIAGTGASELEKQEKIVVYLEKLIPDLEEIMLEKALELKEEMARERVKSMREFYAGKPDMLAKIDSAEEMMNSGKWKSAVGLLNSLS